MIQYFRELHGKLIKIKSDIEARVVLISTVRHLLQVVDYSLVEWISARNPDPQLQPSRELLLALRAPSDGTLVEALEALLISAEQNGWTGACRLVIQSIEESDDCIKVCGDHAETLFGLLRGLVELRNAGGEGHGLPGDYQRKAEQAALAFTLNAIKDFVPRIHDDGDLYSGPSGLEIRLRMLRAYSGNPVLVRSIEELNSATVRVKGQYYNSKRKLESTSYEAWNPFSKFGGQNISSLTEFANSWLPLCYFPDRITDTFTGRAEEKSALIDWLDDTDSRACLVFGDGGVGKTTLVVETLHQFLDEDIEVNWKPKIVTFYTAKRWQFGVNGLSAIGAGSPHLMDLLAHLHVLLIGRHPETSFYKRDVRSAATFLQDSMKSELHLTKNEHLIVVDNAETLIESDEERDTLGKELKEIAKRVGRILITSRRREILGAEPVEVKPLSSIDAVGFLRSRGEVKLKLGPIKRASDVELLAIVAELERRPIVLEAFISALCDPACNTLEKAKKKVLGMLKKDLGSFLFSDAWVRFSKEIRRLLVLMVRVSDVHDAQSFRICSNLSGIQIQDAEKALEESSGIASVVHVGGEMQISFSKNFINFCKDKDVVSADDVARAGDEYSRFLSRARSFNGDRMAAALRTPVAKAAYRAKNEGDMKAARDLFEQALVADNTNGILFDRYAYFLFHDMRDNKAALHQARRATELSPSEGEVWYTRGLIEARIGEVGAAEASLGKAGSLGISNVRCGIQLAWAYLKARPRQLALAERQLLVLQTITSHMLPASKVRLEIEHIGERLRNLRMADH